MSIQIEFKDKLVKRVYPTSKSKEKLLILLNRTIIDRNIYIIKSINKSPIILKLIHQPLRGDLATHYNS